MIEIEPDVKFLEEFLLALRPEDKEEINAVSSCDFKNEFFKICLERDKYTYILKSDNKKPLAIGGAKQTKIKKVARVWLLTTNEFNFSKKKLYKYVIEKIELFKQDFDVLYNFIYKTNFKSLKWLKKCAFREREIGIQDYKLFYYMKGDLCFDLRYFTCE
jgi:hypothetical protein